MRWAIVAGACVLVMALVGCNGARAPVAQDITASEPGAEAALPEPVTENPALERMQTQPLRVRAEAALREQRLHSPAGDNAVEYYLALREREADAGVTAALAEMQPYVLIATEQAIAQQQLDEGHRLIGLLTRMDSHAPALPRLRESLRVTQERADREEGARIAATARPPAAVSPPPPPPSKLSRTVPPSAPLPATVAVAPPPPSPVPAPVASRDTPSPASPTRAEAPPAPVAMPRLLRDAAPRYPLAARNRRIEGRVQVAFVIQPDGSVSDVRAVSAQPEGLFEQAALAAASRWQFEATTRRVNGTRTVTFALPPDPQS